ncbi:DNA-directed RNA polymerase V subunit 7-like protein [Tanacetum coccineum]
MFLKEQLNWNVVIPAENLDIKGLMLQKAILVRLLDDFSAKKATKALGYLLAVTTLDKIGEGKVRELSGDVLFPLSFTCLSFKVFRGEVIEGVVHKILKHGVFLRCGPIENLYLSNQKMTDYQYQIAESPCFLNLKTGSRIEKDVTVRCIVIGVKYMEAEKELQAVVGLEGDYLGPEDNGGDWEVNEENEKRDDDVISTKSVEVVVETVVEKWER